MISCYQIFLMQLNIFALDTATFMYLFLNGKIAFCKLLFQVSRLSVMNNRFYHLTFLYFGESQNVSKLD